MSTMIELSYVCCIVSAFIYFITFIGKMSIRYKANFSQQLASLDYTMAKYPNPSKSHQPSTPEFINSPPQHFQDLGLLREAKTNFSSNMVGLKEQNIKSLDDRINNIMKKH
jgi:hypothetical protein